MQATQFFFIVGRPRSGTTLLLTILDANPHVLIPVEWPVISKLLPKYRHISYFSKEILSEFINDIENCRFHNHYGYKDMNFRHEVIREKILACPPDITFNHLISIVYSHYQSLFEKKEILALGDKNPVASRQIKDLLLTFPEAKFIHISRDYRDHTVSMINAGFGQKNIPLIVYRWNKYQQILLKAYRKHPGRFLRLKYEDMVDNPEKWIRQICEFINIPYYPQMLDFHKNKLDSLYPKDLSKKYQLSLAQAINKGRTGIWQGKFSNQELKIMDFLAGKMADEYGYSRNFKGISLKGLYFKIRFGLRGFLKMSRMEK